MKKIYQGSSHPTKSLYEAPVLNPEQMTKLIEMMEEMADGPTEEFGRREPGERQASEIYANRGTLPDV